MYNLIKNSENYSKKSGGLCQYCRYLPTVNNDGDILDFTNANATDLFKFKEKIRGKAGNDDTK